jgi:hypothetical protein
MGWPVGPKQSAIHAIDMCLCCAGDALLNRANKLTHACAWTNFYSSTQEMIFQPVYGEESPRRRLDRRDASKARTCDRKPPAPTPTPTTPIRARARRRTRIPDGLASNSKSMRQRIRHPLERSWPLLPRRPCLAVACPRRIVGQHLTALPSYAYFLYVAGMYVHDLTSNENACM